MVILKHLDHRKLLISKLQSLVVYDAVSDTISNVGLPESTDGETVTAIATSKCGGYFAVLRGKRVTVYDSGATVVKELVLKRAAHSITLFDGHNMLVADKTGDVYLYKADSNECVLLLGHLSMLLDVVLSDDGKFLITCDRDEKIRVSRYPNTYDIERFCLGHGEFVTKMALLEGGPYLASASGDGKVIVWNYLKGDVLHSVDTAAHVDDRTAINDFVESMEQDKCEVTSLPIVDMQIRKWDAFYCVVVQIYRLKHLQVYSLNVADNTFDSKLLQNIRFATEIETFSLNRELFVSTEESVSMFIVSENIFVEKQNDTLEKLKLSGARDKCCDISTLYKRRFDNVQEYLERKRQRMEGK